MSYHSYYSRARPTAIDKSIFYYKSVFIIQVERKHACSTFQESHRTHNKHHHRLTGNNIIPNL